MRKILIHQKVENPKTNSDQNRQKVGNPKGKKRISDIFEPMHSGVTAAKSRKSDIS